MGADHFARSATAILNFRRASESLRTALRKWRSRMHRIDGWCRILMWGVLANSVHLLALAALPFVVNIGQAQDSLVSLADHRTDLWNWQLLIPGLYAALMIWISAVLLGLRVSSKLARPTPADELKPRYADVVFLIVFPMLLSLGVVVVVTSFAAQVEGVAWPYVAMIFVMLCTVVVLQGWMATWMVKKRRKSPKAVLDRKSVV